MIVDVRHLRQSSKLPFCRGCRKLKEGICVNAETKADRDKEHALFATQET